jgi:hypothetical protein
MAKPLSLIGNRYGSLIVVARAENNKKGNTMWLCKCNCGNEKIALGYDLTHGRTTSCGCQKGNPDIPSLRRIDLVGKRFGNLTVKSLNEEKSKNGILIWDCACGCGNSVSVRGGNLKSGHTTSCGCLSKNTHPKSFTDLTGKKFGRLTVIREDGKKKGKNHGFANVIVVTKLLL